MTSWWSPRGSEEGEFKIQKAKFKNVAVEIEESTQGVGEGCYRVVRSDVIDTLINPRLPVGGDRPPRFRLLSPTLRRVG